MLVPDEPQEPQGPLWKRLAWLVGIWAASVAFLGVVAMIIRYWISP